MDNKEAKKLFRLFQKRPTKENKEKLVKQLEPLVILVAKKFCYKGEILNDIVQIGNIGLLKAINKAKKSLPRHFIQYLIAMVAGEIRHYFRDSYSNIRLPRKYIELARMINQFLTEYSQKHKGKKPRLAEIANKLKVDKEFILETLEALNISQLVEQNEENFVKEDGSDFTERLDNYLTIECMLKDLPYREQKIVQLYFLHNLSQREIAKRYKLSQAQVFRILEKALHKCQIKIKEEKE